MCRYIMRAPYGRGVGKNEDYYVPIFEKGEDSRL